MKTAGETAGRAAVRPAQVNHFLLKIVSDLDFKTPQRAADISSAAVSVFFSVEDLLAHAVLNLILVICLKANNGWKRRELFLVMAKTAQHRDVFQNDNAKIHWVKILTFSN